MADPETLPVRAAAWRRAPEVGTILGIRFVVGLATFLGRPIASAFLWLLAFYYVLFSSRVRRTSRTYLSRVGEPPTFMNVHRLVHNFARTSLDRLYFLRGRIAAFRITKNGAHHLAGLTANEQGALLLGSHLGSFEAMRAASRVQKQRLAVVVDTRNAERLATVIREVGGDAAHVDVIGVDPEGVGTALKVRDAIARGAMVAIMADRALARDERNVVVDFLGAPAAIPAGPFLLAHALRCPVYQVFGLFHPPNHYDLHCELVAERLVLERENREESLRRYAQQYADRVAAHARRAPYNWFNFFDFWNES